MPSASLRSFSFQLLTLIPGAVGRAQEKEWAPVMNERVWALLLTMPPELVELHQRFCPIMQWSGELVLGQGYVRLTAAGESWAAGWRDGWLGLPPDRGADESYWNGHRDALIAQGCAL